MGSLNKVMLIGRLGSDPEKKVTQNGSSVVSFSLATTESYKDKQGNKQETVEWHKVVLWNRLADLAEQYLGKGKQVYIEGSLRTNEWTDKDGKKRYTTEVIGQSIQFIDSGSSDQVQNNNKQIYQQKQQSNNQYSNNIDDEFIEDDLPF